MEFLLELHDDLDGDAVTLIWDGGLPPHRRHESPRLRPQPGRTDLGIAQKGRELASLCADTTDGAAEHADRTLSHRQRRRALLRLPPSQRAGTVRSARYYTKVFRPSQYVLLTLRSAGSLNFVIHSGGRLGWSDPLGFGHVRS